MVRFKSVLAIAASSLMIGGAVGAAYYAHYYKTRELTVVEVRIL